MLKADLSDATKRYLIADFDRVLSLGLIEAAAAARQNAPAADVDVAKIEELIEKRTEARAAKDWATADAIRDELKAMHIVIKDSKDGVSWEVEA